MVGKEFRPESKVQQMRHRMITPHIKIKRTPIVSLVFIPRPLIIPGTGVAEQIPRRAGVAIHRVSLSLGRTTTLGASYINPRLDLS